MKKYDLSVIMKKAWATYRKFQSFVSPLSFSECLRRAWAEAKKAAEQPEQYTLDTIKAIAYKTMVVNGEYESISCREWSNYGHHRVYIKAIRHTLAGNLRVADCGYWDVNANKYVAGPKEENLLA